MKEISGLILLDKPSGPTSHDMVDRVRRKLGISKIGHAGTLDPSATGLLIILAGRAAKKQSEFLHMDKVYSGTVLFGIETDTWDMAGNVISQVSDFDLKKEEIEKHIFSLSGEIIQKIPPYSAVKKNGVPLYKLARKNLPVPQLEKKVKTEWISWNLSGKELFFRVKCSSGTYVRSLAQELGLKTQVKAVLKDLRREKIGPYDVKDAFDEKSFESADTDSLLKPL
ncbi:MAG: tRNA pseudouridine(55) synthase TruB [Elusimicrobia bacterium]|nr:tRNA pseudouridine(55) synthase TruB [Elusimicrobiota bacterium]